MKLQLAVFIVFCSSLQICRAQHYDPFDGYAGKFHADLGLFFKNPIEERESKKKLLDSINVFESQNHWSLRNLRHKLDNYEVLLARLQRHYQYFELLAERNNKDTAAKKEMPQIDVTINVLTARVDSILEQPKFMSITANQLKTNNLTFYTFLLNQEKVSASHLLLPSDEKLTLQLAGNMIDQLTERYDNLMDTIKGIDIQLGGKAYNALTDHVILLKSASSEIRELGEEIYLKSFSNYGELFAAMLIDITAENNALAIAHRFKNAPQQLYTERLQLPEDSVRNLLSKVGRVAGVLKKYQELQKNWMGQRMKTTNVHSWDGSFLATFTWQPLPFAEIKKLILNALAPLGDDYLQHFARLLDPQNGLLEIAGGPDRTAGGNSFGFTGTPIGLYMKSYDGSYKSVFTLIHEGGHAIHRQLMSDNKIIPSYFSGPNFLFESFAMLNELLLLEELEKQAQMPDAKAYFTRLFLDKLSHEIFTSAEEGLFEQGLYDGVAKGKIHNFQDINSLYTGIMRNYDIYFDGEPDRKSEWINKRLVFDDPLYNVNYLFAMLVTCKLYELHLSDPAGFASRYNSLLKNGFSASASTQLKKYMDIDLNNDQLLSGAVKLLEEKTFFLQKLYQQ